MINRMNLREILAWMTLVLSIILISVTIAFAQTKTLNVDRDNGKVHINMITSQHGKTITADTSFSITDETDVDKIVHDFSNSHGDVIDLDDHSQNDQDNNDGRHIKKRKDIIIDGDDHIMTTEEKQKLHDDLEKSMENLRKGLDNMDQSLKEMHIHIDCSDDADKHSHKNFHLNSINPGTGNKSSSNYSYSYSYADDDAADSLDDDMHFIIHGGKNENPPVLEKVVTTDNGKKMFIYKRSGSDDSADNKKDAIHSGQKTDKRDIKNLKYYPNPSNGKFNLSFRNDEKSDITIQVLNENGDEIYSEKLTGFTGDYSKEIDLSGKSKGNYILKISLGKITHSAKIVFN